MRHSEYSPQSLEPRPLPPARRDTMDAARFWTLMDRWQIPPDRALDIIGTSCRRRLSKTRPNFKLSARQAQILSCLMEIEMTLTLAAVEGRLHGKRRTFQALQEVVPLEALGRGNPGQTAKVLWSLQEPPASGRR